MVTWRLHGKTGIVHIVMAITLSIIFTSTIALSNIYVNNTLHGVVAHVDNHVLLIIGRNISYGENLDPEIGYDVRLYSGILKYSGYSINISINGNYGQTTQTTIYFLIIPGLSDAYAIPLSMQQAHQPASIVLANISIKCIDKTSFINRLYNEIRYVLRKNPNDIQELYNLAIIDNSLSPKIIIVSNTSTWYHIVSSLQYKLYPRNFNLKYKSYKLFTANIPSIIEAKYTDLVSEIIEYSNQLISRVDTLNAILIYETRVQANNIFLNSSDQMVEYILRYILDTLCILHKKIPSYPSLYRSPLIDKLSKLMGFEQYIIFTLLIALVPLVAIALIIINSIITPILLRHRPTLSLLMARGIRKNLVYRLLLIHVSIYYLVGGFIGYLVTQLLVSIIYGENIFRFIDIYTLAVSILSPLILVPIYIKQLIRLTETIDPRLPSNPIKYLRYSLSMETPSKLSWILLIIGLYSIIRYNLGISPSNILYEALKFNNVLLIVFSLILVIIDPFLLLFGPVFFIYGLSKILIQYPRILDSLGKCFLKTRAQGLYRLSILILRGIGREIISCIMVLAISMGMVLTGFIGSSTSTALLNETNDILFPTKYILYKPLVINGSLDLRASYDELKTIFRGNVSINFIVFGPVYSTNAFGSLPETINFFMHKHLISNESSDLVYYKDDVGEYIIPKTLYLVSQGEMYRLEYIFVKDRYFNELVRIPNSLFTHRSVSSNLLGKGATLIVSNRLCIRDNISIALKTLDNSAINISRELHVVGCIRNLPSPLPIARIVNSVLYGYTGFRVKDVGSIAGTGSYPIASCGDGVLVDINDLILSDPGKYYRGSIGYLAIILVYANDGIDGSIINRYGFRVYESNSDQWNIECLRNYLILGFNHNIFIGLSLYILSITSIPLLIMSIRQRYPYVLETLYRRGFNRDRIRRIFSGYYIIVLINGLTIGTIIGLALGTGIVNTFLTSLLAQGNMDLGRLYNVYGLQPYLTICPTYIMIYIIMICAHVLEIVYILHRFKIYSMQGPRALY